MDFGAHLPLIDFDGSGYSLEGLAAYAEAARDLGYAALSANDHMLFARPWLDGPAALAAVLSRTGGLELMTTVVLPVIRGPIATAKTLAALDLLSAGRLIVGAGPGSSRADYEAAGLDFDERWKRFDESVLAMKALWAGTSFTGRFYQYEGVDLAPGPARSGGPPIWVGSWGSEVGLRRTARLGDGWLASAYNTAPEDFGRARLRLAELLAERGAAPEPMPNALSTMWTYITDDVNAATRVLQDILAPMLRRLPDELRTRLTVGPPESCAEKLAAYESAGLQRVLIWPVLDARRQLEVFRTRVMPLIPA